MKDIFTNPKMSNQENIEYLEEQLSKYIPMSYETLQKNYPFTIEIKMIHKGKYTPDQLLKLKTKGLDKIKKQAELELSRLKAKL